MMSTKNSAFIITPSFDQNNATLKEMIFANKSINLQNEQHEKYHIQKNKLEALISQLQLLDKTQNVVHIEWIYQKR